MVNRYEAKDIRPKTGLVKTNHKVRMSDGTSLGIKRKGSIKGERNRVKDIEVKDAKRRILNRIPLQERKIRGTMLRAIDDFELIVLKLERLGGRDRQGNLKVVEKSKLLQTCNKFSKNKVKELKKNFFNNPAISKEIEKLEKEVTHGSLSPFKAAHLLLAKNFKG